MRTRRKYVFFIDRDLGKAFHRKLKDAGINVKKFGDYFSDDEKDIDWLRVIGQRGWYAVTHDKKIRHNEGEKTAVEKFRVGLFILVGTPTFDEHANNFISIIKKIENFIKKHDRPFIAKIYAASPNNKFKRGEVKMWLPF